MKVDVKILGNGRVKIHFFVRDPKGAVRTTGRGPFRVPGAGVMTLGGGVGFVACQPQRKTLSCVSPMGIGQPFPISAEFTAVNCPECMATAAFKKAAEAIKEEAVPQSPRRGEVRVNTAVMR